MALSKIFPTSNVTTSVNVPEEFGINTLSTTTNTLILNKHFTVKPDVNGVYSIIEFNSIPYIDFSKYDHDRRMFYDIDKYGGLWRTYYGGDYIIETGQTRDPLSPYPYYYSRENKLYNRSDNGRLVYGPGGPVSELKELEITRFKPITIKVAGEELEDITDYSFNIRPKLDTISPEKNKQFYFDKNNKIHANIDFLFYNIDDEPANLEITYYTNITELNVSCTLSTNNSNYSNYTPVVDYYILKLTGQTL